MSPCIGTNLQLEMICITSPQFWGGLQLRCCWFMEELAPHNAYHAKWALEALLSASRAQLPLEGYAGYARKVLEGHCGPGALEVALGSNKSILKGDAASRPCPPGEVQVTCLEASEAHPL